MMEGISSFVFLHGGPGFNSIAEAELLGPALSAKGKRVKFWNEPSPARYGRVRFSSENAFKNSVASARQDLLEAVTENGPVHLIAHSFGSHIALALAQDVPYAIGALTFICPALDLFEVYLKVLSLAQKDLSTSESKSGHALEQLRPSIRGFMDEPMKKALEIATTDPGLFHHYWKNNEKMESYFKLWQQSGQAFQPEVFFAVISDLATIGYSPFQNQEILIPVQLVFGKHDPITDAYAETAIARRFARGQFTVLNFEHSAHFPHIEEMAAFVRAVI